MLARVLTEGEKFADYVIVRQIGAGGFGAVYEAEHPVLGRRVALKIAHPDVSADPDARARALQEARALAELSHPNVVAIQNAGVTSEGQVWIATELLKGWTLREMRRAPIPVEQALALLAEICDGVAAAHEVHILHRDLKPENIFVTRQVAVKVLDFTAAKASTLGLVASSSEIAAGKQARRVLGTLAYMSPEQARGERPDLRTDVYSVGVIAYEIMGPRHPFADPDGTMPAEYELAQRHAEARPVPLPRLDPSIPSYVWDVVAEALEKDRERRLPSMRLFAQKLRAARERFLKDRDIEAEALAEEWRGAGSFRRHGTADIEPTRPAPRLTSRRVVVQGDTVSEMPAMTALQSPQGESAAVGHASPRAIHITASRPARRARSTRRAAVWVVLAAVAALITAAWIAGRVRGAAETRESSGGVSR